VQKIIGELWTDKKNPQIPTTSASGEAPIYKTIEKLPGQSGKSHGGKKTPNYTYRQPILAALDRLGGRASANDVLKIVEEMVRPVLNEFDLQRLPSGTDVRWHNAAQWVRLSLVKEGLLKSNSPHGIWELSDNEVVPKNWTGC
jgi:hypothetical protein